MSEEVIMNRIQRCLCNCKNKMITMLYVCMGHSTPSMDVYDIKEFYHDFIVEQFKKKTVYNVDYGIRAVDQFIDILKKFTTD